LRLPHLNDYDVGQGPSPLGEFRVLKSCFVHALLAPAAVTAAMTLAGCNLSDIPTNGRAMAPLSEKMVSELNEKHMDKGSPILVRLFKEESELEIWKMNHDGQFALLKTYPICRWSGDLGPKQKEGDRQAPEGFYTITPGQMNPNSSYYLSFNTGYPNAYDRAHGYTGSQLMVHGDCSSRGCYAMTDEQIQEIYALARESFFEGQKAFQLEAFPFRMTALNMAKHRNNPNFAFWKMLKEGYDHFEASRQEPKVAFCEKRYVFDAVAPDNSTKPPTFNPTEKCPAYQLDKTIAATALGYQRDEQLKVGQFIAQGVPTVPLHRNTDGGMNPVFAAKLSTQDAYDSRGHVIQIATAPGSLPRASNIPGSIIITPNQQPASTSANQPLLASLKGPATTSVAKGSDTVSEEEAAAVSDQKRISLTGLIDSLLGNSDETAPPSSAGATTRQTASIPTHLDDTGSKAKQNAVHQVASNAPVRHAQPHEMTATRSVAHNTPREHAKSPAERAPKDIAPQIRTAFSAPAENQNGLLSGAQPVVPAGSFNSRWAGLQ
jgi:murein L,D-transpeptidase YafK